MFFHNRQHFAQIIVRRIFAPDNHIGVNMHCEGRAAFFKRRPDNRRRNIVFCVRLRAVNATPFFVQTPQLFFAALGFNNGVYPAAGFQTFRGGAQLFNVAAAIFAQKIILFAVQRQNNFAKPARIV